MTVVNFNPNQDLKKPHWVTLEAVAKVRTTVVVRADNDEEAILTATQQLKANQMKDEEMAWYIGDLPNALEDKIKAVQVRS